MCFYLLAKKGRANIFLQNLIKRRPHVRTLVFPNNACFWQVFETFHQGLLCRAKISRQEIPWFNVFLLVDHMSRVLATGRMHMRCDLGAPPGGVPVVQVPLSHMWAAMLSWTCARTRTPRCFLPPDLVLHFTWVTHSLQLSIIFPKKRLLRSVRIGGFPLFWAPFWSPFWLKVLSHLSSNSLFRIHHQHVWKISLFGRPDQRLPRDL